MSEETHKKTIILAEDSPTNRTVIKHLLLKLGFNVIECENGKIAWEALETESSKENVVGIISDIMMPEMDGIEFLTKVRASETFKDIPFILVTAVMEKEQVMAAKRMNVAGYILKPVTFQRLSAKLKDVYPDHKFPLMAS